MDHRLRRMTIMIFLILVLSSCSTRPELTPASSVSLAPPTLTVTPGKPTSTSSPPPPSPTPAGYPDALGERAVFTFYFYWYDNGGPAYPDPTNPFRDFPITNPEMTFRGTEWHRRQVEDMIYAGVDAILPVYWMDEDAAWWAQTGLANLVAALEEMRKDGIRPLPVAMFYDTNSIAGEDLRTQAGRDRAYEGINFFYNTVPRSYWALAEGSRPIIWIYSYGPLAGYDQGFIDDLYQRFETQYGVRPYLVLDWNWLSQGIPITYDATYTWVGGTAGFTTQVSTVSPGVDDRLLEVLETHSYVDRQNGDVYRNGLVKAIICNTPWLVLSTWNEYYEATDIAESIQYGRTYLDISREYTGYFKQGSLPEGVGIISAYKAAGQVSIKLGETIVEDGLIVNPSAGDGQYQAVVRGGEAAQEIFHPGPEYIMGYMYFNVDDGFYFARPQPIELTIRYFDEGYQPIYIDYDSAPCASEWDPETMYKSVFLTFRTNSLTWKEITVRIEDATFSGHENGYTDFRISTPNDNLAISDVTIVKLP